MDPYPADAQHLEWSGNLVFRNGDNTQPTPRGFTNPKPVADFTNSQLVRVGEPVTFVSKSTDNGSIASYLWDFGAGLPSSSSKPTYVYDKAGIYRVMLVVWDNEGRSNVKEKLILVSPGLPDTKKPTVPSNLSSSSQTDETIDLTWSPVSDNVGVVSYDVYEDGQLACSTAPGETSFTLTGLTAATTYSITLRARDAAENTSADSRNDGASGFASANGTFGFDDCSCNGHERESDLDGVHR
ncbi:fibronectin type III domain protein [Paenibacillus taihuensis]|uniref:Fibronectin type III domain protein n=1 Tax=Paenibacillus taihuensis TaxID=1156355 RepID=A0A3D9S6V0_9BACL|nr:PKD domain-containing protein [Paenibacillus taihuensis]REE88907.1 fibronectin type III domain protein [Paenibacillus taihuensis]